MYQYLITFTNGESPSYTNWFDPENHFAEGMVVFDLYKHLFTTDGINWKNIQEDHL